MPKKQVIGTAPTGSQGRVQCHACVSVRAGFGLRTGFGLRAGLVVVLLLLFLQLITFVMPGIVAAADKEISGPPRFIDEVGLITESQASQLTDKLDEISIRQQFDVVIYVTHSLKGANARVFAADFYEAQGFGFGADKNGIILMLAMEDRDFAFVTTGYGMYAFTYAGQEYMESIFLPYLGENRYFSAFTAFADTADDFLIKAAAGQPYDYSSIPMTFYERYSDRIWAAVASVVLAFAIPGVIVAVWTGQLKSVKKKDLACDYIRQGSFSLDIQQDIFLHRRVTKTRRAENSGGGGGSSGSFRSSSGGSFSGRSGKF